MRNSFYKYFPILFGLFLGWLLFHPPAWFSGLGPISWVLNLALVALLLLSFVPFLALANLPQELQMRPMADRDVPAKLNGLREQFYSLGFRDAGPPLRVEIAPAATLLGFVHPTEPVYGTAFQTDTVPPKVGHDLVSILDGDRGGLTTNTDPSGAALPASAGGFRQVLPDQSLDALLQAHVDGIRYLREQGVGVRPVSADAFQRDLAMGIRKQRETFLSSPLRGSALTLWRAATKQVPFVGSLREQRIATEQLKSLLAGRTQRAF
jgi:hypothetical protein